MVTNYKVIMDFKLMVMLFGIFICSYVLDGVEPSQNRDIDIGDYNHVNKPSIRDQAYNGGTEFVGIVVEQSGLFGASAQISIHNPKPVNAGQSSFVMIIIQNWPDQIEAGWTVNPDLYHDGQTRLYTWWRSATNPAGCYNTNCPGFIIVNDEIPLDYVFPEVSNPQTGEKHEVEITIQRGDAAGNWYLEVNGNILGFWRGDLLPNLANSATAIRFGGQVYITPPTNISPPMGSGLFYGDNPSRTCYMQNVQVRLDTFVPVPSNYQKIARSRCYLAGWDGYSGDDHLNGFRFLLGGTGGKAGEVCLD